MRTVFVVPISRKEIRKAINTSKLVKKPVMVSRGGKTYQTMRWVKPGEAPAAARTRAPDEPKQKRTAKPEQPAQKRPAVAAPKKHKNIGKGDTISFKAGGQEVRGIVIDDSHDEGVVVKADGGKKYNVKWSDIAWTDKGKGERAPSEHSFDVQWLLDSERDDNQKKIDKSLLVQPSGDLDELYKLAEEARPGFKQFMEQAAEQLGAKKLLSRPVLKSKERILEKMKEDGAKDSSQIYDIDGHTLVFDDLEGVAKALRYFMSQGGSVRVKNNYAKPSPAGYRDVNINFKLPNGMISEVQINTEAMMEAKEGPGHVFYEVMRECLGSVPPPPPPPPYGEVLDAQKAFYSFAWEASSGQRPVANLKASLLDIARPFWNKSAKSLAGRDSSWLSPKTRKRFIEFGSQAKGTSSFS